MKQTKASSIFKQPIFKKIGLNTVILFGINAINSALAIVQTSILGRALGSVGFGQYNFVMIWLNSQISIAEFGMAATLNRDLAAEPEKTGAYLFGSIYSKALLFLPITIGFMILAPYISTDQNNEVIVGLRWGIVFVAGSLTYSSLSAVFRAHQIMLPLLWVTLIGQLVQVGGLVILLLHQMPLPWLIVWVGGSQWLKSGIAAIFYRNLKATTSDLFQNRTIVNLRLIKTLFQKAWPFALSVFLALLQFRSSVLLLAYLHGDQALGLYEAGNRFVLVIDHLFGAFYSAILPALTGLTNSQQTQTMGQHMIGLIVRNARLGLLIITIIISFSLGLFAKPILTFVYNETFQAATLSLQIQLFHLIFRSQNNLSIIHLYAHRDIHYVNKLIVFGILITFTVSYILVPTWGAAGTAMSLLIADCLLYLPFVRRVQKVSSI